ncbi:MAG: pilus assembly protein PilM [Planctomycetes bacterium]|nr:pilus assembly protein PilM [Planctomycetota bacterium]
MGYGIDIGTTALKVVAVQPTLRGFRVVGASRVRLPRARSPQTLARSLREALGAGPGVGVMGLNGREVNLQPVLQPRMKPANYRAMMGYEIDQRLGEGGDLYADYCTLREPDPYFPQYLAIVGVGKKTSIDERVSLAAAAEVDLRDAVPTSFALFTAYRNAYGAEHGTTLLLDIGSDQTDMALARGGRLLLCRSLLIGGRLFDQAIADAAGVSEAEAEARKIRHVTLIPAAETSDPNEEELRPRARAAAVQLLGAVQASVNLARAQLADKELIVDKIYLSGGGARLRGLPEYFQSAMKVPVENLDPFRNVDPGPLKGHSAVSARPADLTVALGLAQISTRSRSPGTISILPDRLKRRRDFFRGPMYLIAAGLLLAAATAAVTGIAFYRKAAAREALAQFQSDHRAVRERIEKMDEAEAELARLVAKRRLLESHIAPGRVLLDAVQKMRKILPEGVFVRSIELHPVTAERGATAPPRRIVFAAPGRGILEGVVPARRPAEARTETETQVWTHDGSGPPVLEAFPREILDRGIAIEAPWSSVQIVGEIDDSVPNGVNAALDDVKFQLTDPSRGVVAELYQEGGSTKPGWQAFRILLKQE